MSRILSKVQVDVALTQNSFNQNGRKITGKPTDEIYMYISSRAMLAKGVTIQSVLKVSL